MLRSGLLWAAFCCFALASRPAASAEPDFLCDVGLTLLLNMKVKKPLHPMNGSTGHSLLSVILVH